MWIGPAGLILVFGLAFGWVACALRHRQRAKRRNRFIQSVRSEARRISEMSTARIEDSSPTLIFRRDSDTARTMVYKISDLLKHTHREG